ncbi:MAG: RsmE family RNA methyltransferase [Dehalococcoidia bacterium]
MRVPRFYTASDLRKDEVTLEPDTTRRLRTVLRLRPGDLVRLFDGAGREAKGRLLEGGAIAVYSRGKAHEQGPEVHLFPALFKANRFDWLVEKAVELGATAIHPVVCERSILDERSRRAARWRRIAVEAAEQSERRVIPPVHEAVSFQRGLEEAPGLKVFAWEGEPSRRIDVATLGEGAPVSIFTGPEGGYTDAEVEMARAAGALIVTLGQFTLRAETAAVVALGAVVTGLPENAGNAKLT